MALETKETGSVFGFVIGSMLLCNDLFSQIFVLLKSEMTGLEDLILTAC